MVILRSAPAFLEPQVYRALLEGVEPFEGEYGLGLRWRFILEDPPLKVRRVAYSSLPAGRRSKASRWAAALLGRPQENGEFDADRLAGRRCRVELSLAQHEDGDPYNVVENVFPFTEQSQPAEPDPAAEGFVLDPPSDDEQDVPF